MPDDSADWDDGCHCLLHQSAEGLDHVTADHRQHLVRGRVSQGLNPMDDEFIGPAQMRRMCRVQGARLLLTGHPQIWVLVVGKFGWYIPRSRYLRSEFQELITRVRTGGWEAAWNLSEAGRGYTEEDDAVQDWLTYPFLMPRHTKDEPPMRREPL